MTQTTGAELGPGVGGQGPNSLLSLTSSKIMRSQPSFLERLDLKEALGESKTSKRQAGLRRVGVCYSHNEV